MNELDWWLPSWGHRKLLTVTYYNAAMLTENHLRFVNDRHVACKRLVGLQVSCVHVDWIKRQEEHRYSSARTHNSQKPDAAADVQK